MPNRVFRSVLTELGVGVVMLLCYEDRVRYCEIKMFERRASRVFSLTRNTVIDWIKERGDEDVLTVLYEVLEHAKRNCSNKHIHSLCHGRLTDDE